jgi:hypothetical protein
MHKTRVRIREVHVREEVVRQVASMRNKAFVEPGRVPVQLEMEKAFLR